MAVSRGKRLRELIVGDLSSLELDGENTGVQLAAPDVGEA